MLPAPPAERLRHRIIPLAAQRMTTAQTRCRQPQSPDCSETLKCFNGVIGAGRYEPALPADPAGEYQLVETDEGNTHFCSHRITFGTEKLISAVV